MKTILLALAILLSSLFANATPIGQAGGLDTLCQTGNGVTSNHKDGKYGENNPAQSEAIATANACIGYINGWQESMDGAFIQSGGILWHIDFANTFNSVKEVSVLHTFLQAHPEAGKQPSVLILLEAAVDAKIATVQRVVIQTIEPPDDINPTVPPTIIN